MRVDTSGNLGLGVTPSAWSLFKVMDIGPSLSLATNSASNSDARLFCNTYYDGSYRYKNSAAASQYQMGGGVHYWYTAPSGTAGNAITFTQAMTLDASGNLVVGNTSAYSTANKNLEINGTGDAAFNVSVGGTNYGYLYASTSSVIVGSRQNVPLVFNTNNTERARIASTGQMSTTNGAGTVSLAYDARAWVNFNGTGTVAIRASGNVSSITDNGTGNYTVNFSTAMPDANYGINTSNGYGTGSEAVFSTVNSSSVPSTTAFNFRTRDNSANFMDCSYLFASVFR